MPLAEAGSSFESDSSSDASPIGPDDLLGSEGAVLDILNAKRPFLHSPMCIALQLVLISVLTLLLALPALLYVLFVRMVPCTPIPASLPHSIHTVIRGRRWAERAKRRVTARVSARAAKATQRGCAPSPRGTELQQLHQRGELSQADSFCDGDDGGSGGEYDLETGRGGGLYGGEELGPPRPPETRHPACDWHVLHAGLCWLTGPHQPLRPTVVYVHGWEPGTTSRGFRETLHWRANTRHTGIGVTAELVPDVDALPLWAARGWNVAIFYWNQFADDTLAEAERKIHSAAGGPGGGGMRWQRRRRDGTTVHTEAAAGTPCVAELLARAIEPLWRGGGDELGEGTAGEGGGAAPPPARPGGGAGAAAGAEEATAAAAAAALGQLAGVAAVPLGPEGAGLAEAGIQPGGLGGMAEDGLRDLSGDGLAGMSELGLGESFGTGAGTSALPPQIDALAGDLASGGGGRGCTAGGGRAGARRAGSGGGAWAGSGGEGGGGRGCGGGEGGCGVGGGGGRESGCLSDDSGGGSAVGRDGVSGAGVGSVSGCRASRRGGSLPVRQLRLVGHSLGAQLVLEAAARLLARHPPTLRKHLPLSEVKPCVYVFVCGGGKGRGLQCCWRGIRPD
jgi:hypothetical protein